jgi:hypothetical protein
MSLFWVAFVVGAIPGVVAGWYAGVFSVKFDRARRGWNRKA